MHDDGTTFPINPHASQPSDIDPGPRAARGDVLLAELEETAATKVFEPPSARTGERRPLAYPPAR